MSLSNEEIAELLRLVGLTRDEEIDCERCLALLAEFAERCNGARLATFEFKATAPLYAGLRSTVVCLPPDGDGNGTAHVVRNDGAVAMQATYRLR